MMEEDKMKDFQKNWQDLIKPKRIEKEEKSDTPFYAKFICEPLERGYGVTLGNARLEGYCSLLFRALLLPLLK